MALRLTMVCCGATAATRRALFPIDEPLEAQALADAGRLAGTVRRADRVFTSPSLSARQTAQAFSSEATAIAALGDCDYGDWAGCDLAGLEAHDPAGLAAWLSDPQAAPHGGETHAALVKRAGGWLDETLAQKGHAVAVTHSAVIRSAVLHVLSAPLASFWRIDIPPLSITELRSDGRRWALRAAGVPIGRL